MLTCALSGGACAIERARLQPPDGRPPLNSLLKIDNMNFVATTS